MRQEGSGWRNAHLKPLPALPASKNGQKSRCPIAKGSHLIGGSVQIDLQIDFSGDTKHCQMSYLGEMKATGLMGKFLKSKADKVASRVDAALKELGRRLENNQRSYEARNPAAVNKAV